jgi:hypothetical protein
MLYSGIAEIKAFEIDVDKKIFIQELEAENEGEHYNNNEYSTNNNVGKKEIVVNGESKTVVQDNKKKCAKC